MAMNAAGLPTYDRRTRPEVESMLVGQSYPFGSESDDEVRGVVDRNPNGFSVTIERWADNGPGAPKSRYFNQSEQFETAAEVAAVIGSV